MGMFDYVRSEMPLPDGYEGELQTKHFDDPYMVTHVISKDGRLMQAVIVRTEIVPKAERPYPEAPDGSALAWCGSQRTIVEMRDADYHGMFYFGGLETIGHEPDERYGPRGKPIYKYHDYVAKFTDGQLVDIRMDDA